MGASSSTSRTVADGAGAAGWVTTGSLGELPGGVVGTTVLDRRVVAQPVDGDVGALDGQVVDVAGVDGDVGALNGEGVDVLRGNLDVGALDRQRVEVTVQGAGTTVNLVGDLWN